MVVDRTKTRRQWRTVHCSRSKNGGSVLLLFRARMGGMQHITTISLVWTDNSTGSEEMNLPPHLYNASICTHEGKRYMVARQHDRGDSWRTSLYICEMDECWNAISCQPIKPPLAMAENSAEDARLFSFQGKLRMSWTISQYPTSQFRAAVAIGELIQDDSGWSVGNYFLPAYGRNDFSGMEKNFCPYVVNDQLYVWYGIVNNEQIVFKLDGANVGEVYKSPALPWAWGEIHGGAITRTLEGKLIFVFNSRTGSLAVSTHRYYSAVAELSPSAPFQMLRISRSPVLRGQEGVNLDGYKFFKPSVVFCCGALCENDKLLIAHGWNDAKCRLALVSREQLKL